MGQMKTLRDEVFQFLIELQHRNQFDRFTAVDQVRNQFKLTRHQSTQLVTEFRQYH